MGAKPKAQTVGFRYSFDIHGAIAKAIDGLLQIRASGKVAWSGNATTSQTITINAPNLFGGDKGEGGIQGRFDLMMGDEAQPLNASLAAALGGGLVPNFRGFAGFFYSGQVTSINPYPKPWELLRYRRMNGWDGAVWYPETCAINLAGGQVRAMNPAHILYEVYTNRENGLGIDRSMLDETAFRAAALKLFNEGFGLCLGWKRSAGSLADFRDQITDHIGAYCGPDRNSGLITLKLIRDDYTVADLPLFDEDSGLLSIEEDETSSALIAPSQLLVEYTDAITGETRRARAVNQAIAQLQGGPSSETKSYPGIPTGDLAARVAQRDMRVKASNLRKYKVKLDRRGSSIGPADAFRIRSLKRGIAEVVVRAGKIEDGTLANGIITITALQDVFGLPSASFIAVPPSGYVPPDRTPYAPLLRRLMEVPYRDIAGQVDQANLALLDVTAAWVAGLAVQPSGLSISYNLTSRPGASGAFVDRGIADWCPSAQLVSGIAAAAGAAAVTLSNGIGLDRVAVGSAALVDNEIVRVDAINATAGTCTLARGCADTVPAPHLAGARIWFFDSFEGIDETEYSSGVTVQVQMLTNTSTGQLSPGMAATDSLALVGRQGRPYPPGNLRLNAAVYPAAVTGEVTVSVSHRDRLSQADQLIDTTLGDIGPEAGTQYRFRFYSGADLKREVVQAGTSYTYLLTTEISDGGPFNPLRVVVDSVRGGLYSLQAHDVSVARLGLVTAPPIRLSITQSAFGTNTTAHLVAMPAAVAAGDLLLMHFVNDGNATVTTPAGWTLLNSTLNGTQVRSGWYYKLAAGTEGGTTVDMVTSVAEHAAAQVHRFQAGTFDSAVAPAIAVATGTSVSPNPPNLAPAWGVADTYWIAAYGADDDDATTAWPWTEGQTYTPSGTGTETCSAASCVLALRVASIDPPTFTMAASEEWVAATVAIKPAP